MSHSLAALKEELSQHDVTTVPERGWAGKTNGELLELASGTFDAFITADQGLEYLNLRSAGCSRVPRLSATESRDLVARERFELSLGGF